MTKGLVAGLLLVAGSAHVAWAQVRASERSMMSQTIDGTVLIVDYARPRVQGRAVLFGKEVAWGEAWTPGANWATTLDVSRNIRIDGHEIPKGKYSVWLLVKPGTWTAILDPRFKRYHTEHPDSTAAQIRWTVTPATGTFTEALTWSFPDIRPDGGSLVMQWGTTRVNFDVAVTPSHPLTIARADVERFIGKYAFRWIDEPDTLVARDTMELYYEGGSLEQRYPTRPDWYPSIQGALMVRINDEWFIPTFMKNGRVWEMIADMVYEFASEGGRVTGFELYDDKDTRMGSGRKLTPP